MTDICTPIMQSLVSGMMCLPRKGVTQCCCTLIIMTEVQAPIEVMWLTERK